MPNAQETANSFAASDRGSSGEWSSEVDVCYPQHASFGKFDAQGHAAGKIAECDTDPKPENKNPRSVSDQNPEYDAQGK